MRQHYMALGVIVVLLIVILSLPGRTTARMKLGISSLFLPLFGLAGSAQQLVGRASDAVLPRGELLKQLEQLRRENQELQLKMNQNVELERENEKLRKLFSWQQQQRWKFKLAKVVLRDPANWWRTVRIDLGTRDDIQPGMAVLSSEGALVGKIASAGYVSSQVVLLGDPNCKVYARIDNESRDTGVVAASGPLESEFVDMRFLRQNANIKSGQLVKTSGEGGIFPADILIGKIVDARPAEY